MNTLEAKEDEWIWMSRERGCILASIKNERQKHSKAIRGGLHSSYSRKGKDLTGTVAQAEWLLCSQAEWSTRFPISKETPNVVGDGRCFALPDKLS